eukprot:TRINITY_DN1812_c0_g1_i1.p2 TRINITY_DN1812_c0_g1~~TRINITY_DN1812_c0_g1_i1.p2  ORF type:complete len:165 (+),score=34.88 TRINITY_DN1812_c0_g1_i1:685-1179(+)
MAAILHETIHCFQSISKIPEIHLWNREYEASIICMNLMKCIYPEELFYENLVWILDILQIHHDHSTTEETELYNKWKHSFGMYEPFSDDENISDALDALEHKSGQTYFMKAKISIEGIKLDGTHNRALVDFLRIYYAEKSSGNIDLGNQSFSISESFEKFLKPM